MKQEKFDSEEFKKKIALGFDLAFQKLLKEKKANDGTFVFSKNGKIVKVKAKDY
jgi:sulfur carrier protein ThiS